LMTPIDTQPIQDGLDFTQRQSHQVKCRSPQPPARSCSLPAVAARAVAGVEDALWRLDFRVDPQGVASGRPILVRGAEIARAAVRAPGRAARSLQSLAGPGFRAGQTGLFRPFGGRGGRVASDETSLRSAGEGPDEPGKALVWEVPSPGLFLIL
jgi:hypothetical protein